MPENKKLVVFDMDDVMYNFNEKIARITQVAYEKFCQFNVYTNPLLTEEERGRILKAYADAGSYKNIVFLPKVIELINGIYNSRPDCQVQISSNCSTKAIRDVKMEQLLEVLDLPECDIHLHVIDMKTQSFQKKLPEKMFLLVDDSPHNIQIADARHLIMPARYHNDVLVNGFLNGRRVDRPNGEDEVVATVNRYLSA